MPFTNVGTLTQGGSGTAVINTILTEEANRIGSDIHSETLHTSPWIDLIKKSAFPSDMGYQLNTIIYDRALPVRDTDSDGSTGDEVTTAVGLGTWVADIPDASRGAFADPVACPLGAHGRPSTFSADVRPAGKIQFFLDASIQLQAPDLFLDPDRFDCRCISAGRFADADGSFRDSRFPQDASKCLARWATQRPSDSRELWESNPST